MDYLKQNADAKTISQKINTEIKNIQDYINSIFADSKANSSTVIELPLYGSTYCDVSVSWSCESEFATINSNGIMSFITPEANTTVKLNATIACDDIVSEQIELIDITLEVE